MIYIIFVYLNIKYTIECYKEDKIEDICSNFASKNKINKKKLLFKYKDNKVDQNQTLNQFLNNNNIIINEFAIDVIDIPFSPISSSFFIAHKIKIIIIASIAIISIITVLTVIAIMGNKEDDEEEKDTTRVTIEPTKVSTTLTAIPDSSEPSNVILNTSTTASVPSTIIHSTEPSIKCDDGYILLETECFIDYFIKAIYSSKANENIRLISDEYNLNKIRKMIIDGKTIKPTKNYTFNKMMNILYFCHFFHIMHLQEMKQLAFLMELKTY